jgi:hypothetical protein
MTVRESNEQGAGRVLPVHQQNEKFVSYPLCVGSWKELSKMLRQRHVSTGFGPFDVFSPKMDMNSENVNFTLRQKKLKFQNYPDTITGT